MHLTSSHIALSALWLALPSIFSLALAPPPLLLGLAHENPHQLQARADDAYYPPYLHPTTMADAAAAMNFPHASALRYLFTTTNTYVPSGPHKDATARVVRVIKVTCWDANWRLKPWRPLSGVHGKPVWLVIVAERSPATGAWGTYVGYMALRRPFPADAARYRELGYTADPVGVESVVMGTRVEGDGSELGVMADWVEVVEFTLKRAGLLYQRE
ncbi:MAG: hypothetical protein M1829_000337 [Trizodia sp. TS-e1964]|nr:MAG: hypothetical protein M1829_000337 [Trizodia sp. TS-e1964]